MKSGRYFTATTPILLLASITLTGCPVILTGTLTGHVTDAATGDPIQDATATLTDYGNRQTTTSPEGVFLFPAVPATTHTLRIDAEGYQSQTLAVTVPPEDTATLEIALEPKTDAITGCGPNPAPRTNHGDILLLLATLLALTFTLRRAP